jgi:Uma2 family endonuclease
MTNAAPRQWTVEEFFAWQEKQPERYELVEGVPARTMVGTTNVHHDIVVNVLAELRNQLRGGGCRPFTSDGSIETKPGQSVVPTSGSTADAETPTPPSHSAPRRRGSPLSPTTRDFDTIGKLEEYQLVDSLTRIVVIEPNAPEVIVWVRGDDRSWRKAVYRGLEQEIDMPEIGVTLALAEIYDGVEFPARPRLVAEEETSPAPPHGPEGG